LHRPQHLRGLANEGFHPATVGKIVSGENAQPMLIYSFVHLFECPMPMERIDFFDLLSDGPDRVPRGIAG
jgi:hypothetical protein